MEEDITLAKLINDQDKVPETEHCTSRCAGREWGDLLQKLQQGKPVQIKPNCLSYSGILRLKPIRSASTSVDYDDTGGDGRVGKSVILALETAMDNTCRR